MTQLQKSREEKQSNVPEPPIPTVQRDPGLRTDGVSEQSSQRRSQFPGSTKDRECPPRCLVSLRTLSPSIDPAGGPGAAVQSTSQVLLVLYPGLSRKGQEGSIFGPGTPCREEQETQPALAEPGALRTSCKASQQRPGGEH